MRVAASTIMVTSGLFIAGVGGALAFADSEYGGSDSGHSSGDSGNAGGSGSRA